MTASVAISLGTCAPSGAPAAQAYGKSAAPAPLALRASVVQSTSRTASGTGSGPELRKHFAMAGIDINVWPPGPQERWSG